MGVEINQNRIGMGRAGDVECPIGQTGREQTAEFERIDEVHSLLKTRRLPKGLSKIGLLASWNRGA